MTTSRGVSCSPEYGRRGSRHRHEHHCFHRRLHPAGKAECSTKQNTCERQRQAGKGNNSAVRGDSKLIVRLPVPYCSFLRVHIHFNSVVSLGCHSQGCTCPSLAHTNAHVDGRNGFGDWRPIAVTVYATAMPSPRGQFDCIFPSENVRLSLHLYCPTLTHCPVSLFTGLPFLHC